jgi:hypothetical protein
MIYQIFKKEQLKKRLSPKTNANFCLILSINMIFLILRNNRLTNKI